jgi:hypothetical protein
MSSDPLIRWSGVTEWEGEVKCIVSAHDDIETSAGVVVGFSDMLATYEASVRLSTVGGFSWSGNGSATGSWAERSEIDASGSGFTLISKETVDGGGSAPVQADLDFAIDVSTNLGVYSLRSFPLDMDVVLTISHITSSGLPGDPPSEVTSSSDATRTISFPSVSNEPLPLDASTITGAKTVGLSGSEVANLSWSLRPNPDPTPTPTVEIQIRKTARSDDDLVLLACQHPRGRMKVPCRIRLTSQEANPVTIALTTPDGRLRFPKEADWSKTLTLQPSGKWVQFQISGQAASENVGDAVINAHLDSALGPVIGNKRVTVVSFRNPLIRVTRGSPYKWDPADGSLEVPEPGAAVLFEAAASIYPPQVKCDVPPLESVYIAIIQDVIDYEKVDTLDNPSIEWEQHVPDGKTVGVPKVISYTRSFDRSVHPGPISDWDESPRSTPPLYNDGDDAVRPLGCDEGGTVEDVDSPANWEATTHSQTALIDAAPVGTVTWNRLLRRELRFQFRTYCVVYDFASGDSEGKHGKYCALSQTDWELSLDSSAQPPERVTVHPQEILALSDPANTAVRASDPAILTSNTVGIGPVFPIQKPATTPP